MTTPSLDVNQANSRPEETQGSASGKTPEPAADNSQDGATPNLVVQHHGSGARGQAATAESPRSPNHPFQKLLKVLLWSGIFAGTAATSALVGAGVALMVPLPDFLGQESSQPFSIGELWQSGLRYQVTRPVNILVMGIDEVPGANENSTDIFTGRTDTLLLVRVNPEDGTVSVMSIPRDTRVQIPGYGMDKINHANVEGGPELVAQTIAYNLGNIQIDRYVRVSTGAFFAKL